MNEIQSDKILKKATYTFVEIRHGFDIISRISPGTKSSILRYFSISLGVGARHNLINPSKSYLAGDTMIGASHIFPYLEWGLYF